MDERHGQRQPATSRHQTPTHQPRDQSPPKFGPRTLCRRTGLLVQRYRPPPPSASVIEFLIYNFCSRRLRRPAPPHDRSEVPRRTNHYLPDRSSCSTTTSAAMSVPLWARMLVKSGQALTSRMAGPSPVSMRSTPRARAQEPRPTLRPSRFARVSPTACWRPPGRRSCGSRRDARRAPWPPPPGPRDDGADGPRAVAAGSVRGGRDEGLQHERRWPVGRQVRQRGGQLSDVTGPVNPTPLGTVGALGDDWVADELRSACDLTELVARHDSRHLCHARRGQHDAGRRLVVGDRGGNGGGLRATTPRRSRAAMASCAQGCRCTTAGARWVTPSAPAPAAARRRPALPEARQQPARRHPRRRRRRHPAAPRARPGSSARGRCRRLRHSPLRSPHHRRLGPALRPRPLRR